MPLSRFVLPAVVNFDEPAPGTVVRVVVAGKPIVATVDQAVFVSGRAMLLVHDEASNDLVVRADSCGPQRG